MFSSTLGSAGIKRLFSCAPTNCNTTAGLLFSARAFCIAAKSHQKKRLALILFSGSKYPRPKPWRRSSASNCVGPITSLAPTALAPRSTRTSLPSEVRIPAMPSHAASEFNTVCFSKTLRGADGASTTTRRYSTSSPAFNRTKASASAMGLAATRSSNCAIKAFFQAKRLTCQTPKPHSKAIPNAALMRTGPEPFLIVAPHARSSSIVAPKEAP